LPSLPVSDFSTADKLMPHFFRAIKLQLIYSALKTSFRGIHTLICKPMRWSWWLKFPWFNFKKKKIVGIFLSNCDLFLHFSLSTLFIKHFCCFFSLEKQLLKTSLRIVIQKSFLQHSKVNFYVFIFPFRRIAFESAALLLLYSCCWRRYNNDD
jgi:hypothetical protein